MVHINWNQDDGSLKPGVYLATVRDCSVERSKKSGAEMFKLTLQALDRKLCYDYVMLGGEGWSMGKAKLTALGFRKETDSEIDPYQVVGLKVYVATATEEYQGKVRLKVDGKRGHAGYWPISEVPPDAILEEPAADTTPF